MAISIDVKNNPIRSVVGQKASDETLIRSGETNGPIRYQIQRFDQVGTLTKTASIEVSSNDDITKSGVILETSVEELRIILESRTKWRVRIKRNEFPWSKWKIFRTRDKRYQSPDAITQLTDDSDASAAQKKNRIINVTNSAKAVVVNTTRGATVTVTDTGYVSTTSITNTASGATVQNLD